VKLPPIYGRGFIAHAHINPIQPSDPQPDAACDIRAITGFDSIILVGNRIRFTKGGGINPTEAVVIRLMKSYSTPGGRCRLNQVMVFSREQAFISLNVVGKIVVLNRAGLARYCR
jgi:hypothetical protein